MLHLLVAAALLAPTVPVTSASDSLLASEDPQAREQIAQELVDLIHPTPQMIESNVRSWRAVALRTARDDAAMGKLEAEYPGIIEAAIEAAIPSATEYSRDFVRQAKEAKVRVLAEQLSISDMRDVREFFATPTGQRFLQRMSSKTDVDVLADELATQSSESDADKAIGQAVNKSFRSTLAGTMSETSPSDIIEIMKFEARPSAKKFARAGQEADELILQIAANPDPKFITMQQEASLKGAIKFMEGHSRSTSAK